MGLHIQMNGTVSEAVPRSGPEHLRECGFAAPLRIEVRFHFLLKGLKQWNGPAGAGPFQGKDGI